MFGWGARRKARQDLRCLTDDVRRALPLETERLLLRTPTREDADAVAACIDPEIVAANGWTDRVARRLVRVAKLGLLGKHQPYLLVTTRGATSDVRGAVMVSRVDPDRRTCELGWWMRRGARGQGYGTEAVGAVIAVLHHVGVGHVLVGTATDNEAVMRVLDKVGARRIEERPHRLPNGQAITSAWYTHDAHVPDEIR